MPISRRSDCVPLPIVACPVVAVVMLESRVPRRVHCECCLSAYVASCRSADKSLARPTSWCILFDGENISFDTSLVLYIYI